MGVKQDVEDSLKDYFITKINRQPTEKDLSKLKLELSEGLASIPTLNGGGHHGHIGLIIPNAEYTTFSNGNAPYNIVNNPGPYPATVDPDPLVRERQIAEHKAEVKEYETQLGVASWAWKAIVGAVDKEWLPEIRNPHVGFNHKSPLELLTHLEDVGGVVDYMDVGDKVERQLEKAGIPAQPELRHATSLCWFQHSGEFDYALDNWEAKPAAQKTFSNFWVFIQKEFAKRTKRDKQTAKSVGRGIANAAAEQDNELNALAMAEFVNAVMTQSNAQMEKMMEMFKTSLESLSSKQSGGEARQTHPKCPHCKLRHPKPDDCWELEKNASKRPTNWKPVAERKKKLTQQDKKE
eukprot:CCRYP_002794-RA/>CCRYP_002794-RA protein AED:0.40 eAED:0.40 QI:0/0/0/1/0/0.5/2/0/349